MRLSRGSNRGPILREADATQQRTFVNVRLTSLAVYTPTKDTHECISLYGTLQQFCSSISRLSLGKLPLLLVHLFRHQQVRRTTNPTTLMRDSHYYHI